MKQTLFFLLCLLPLSLSAQDWERTPEITSALQQVNEIRLAAGLQPVELSEELSQGCHLHALYLVENSGDEKVAGMNAHEEFPELKGYSETGKAAGKSSVINYRMPSQSVAGWEASFYHRIPLLQPELVSIGIGYAEGGQWGATSLIDCIRGQDYSVGKETEVVYYPAHGQEGLGLNMGPEIPDPTGGIKGCGFPITVFFCQGQKIKDVKFKLKAPSGKYLPCLVSTTKEPATYFEQWNSVCAIPKTALEANSIYAYKITCTVDGMPFSKVIKFKTGK